MNTLYFNYALEVEKTASITQAADNLFMTQPTLSKAIKDLETGLGFQIFRRTSKGMVPTQKGTEFLTHARKIVAQIEKMQLALQARDTSNQLFSLAIPHADYMAQAVSRFVCSFDNSRDMELDILETSSLKVIEAVASSHFVLGIIRCHTEDEDYFVKNLTEKGLQFEDVWQSEYVALMSKDHPLADADGVRAGDLAPYIEIVYGDDDVPYIRVSEAQGGSTKRLLVYDRGMLTDFLRQNRLSYCWASPMSAEALEQGGLVQKKCRDAGRFKDILVSRQGYRFSKLDRAFIHELYFQRNEIAYGE